jgi:O-acetyl-ADP-ribose deacetylase (regulator of RNase III)
MRRGDLFLAEGAQAFAHGCNCAGAMGKGIAVEFKRRWPKMFDAYKRECAAGRLSPGELFVWQEGDVTVYNLGTQRTWRSKAELDFVSDAVAAMMAHARGNGVTTVSMPKIGSGLGGLDWPSVRAVLDRLTAASSVDLVVYEL